MGQLLKNHKHQAPRVDSIFFALSPNKHSNQSGLLGSSNSHSAPSLRPSPTQAAAPVPAAAAICPAATPAAAAAIVTRVIGAIRIGGHEVEMETAPLAALD